MSYLDSLENNLKALERLEEKDPEQLRRDAEARDSERARALRIAPHADALRNGEFTSQFLTACRTVGHGMRMLVRFTWLEQTLRLEAKDKKLELQPLPEGIQAVFFVNGETVATEMLDLSGDPVAFAHRWLES
ncbi:MAG: hypothetical protein NTZ56_21290 [Acidobacteria bacterium]|nr:hypothetical protein [Acidobacteriota bacterium]